MGSNFSAKKAPPVVAECTTPVYCVKKMGSRHLLIAGGGGSAKTGVANNIETLLFTFDPKTVKFASAGAAAKLTSQHNTGPYATMNMDVVSIGALANGNYLIAAGHDQYCSLYETTGFDVNDSDDLSFKTREVARLTTDERVQEAYQKCVKFDRSRNGQRVATGGSDGHIRIWDVRSVVENRDPTIRHRAILDIAAHTAEVDDVDISVDGTLIASVGDGKAVLWDYNNGKLALEVPYPPELKNGYKVRSLRFTPFGQGRHVFVVAFNQIQRTSKANCFIVLYAFNRERDACRIVALREIPKAAISSLTVSSCGDFTGVGTLGGSVGIFDTHELKPLLWNADTHGIFVTGLEFLDRTCRDLILDQNGSKAALPGVAASWKAAMVSLSADQTVQLHVVPLPHPTPLSALVMKVCIVLVLVQIFLYFVAPGS